MYSKKIGHGQLFGDSIVTGSASKRFGASHLSRARLFLLPFFLIVALLVLFIKLSSVQLFNGSYYRSLSDSNRIRTTVLPAPRGVVFDRNGVPLVYNVPGYTKVENDKVTILDKDTALQLIAKGDKNVTIDSLREYPFGEALSHVLGYTGQITKDELSQSEFSTYLPTDSVGEMGIESYYEPRLRGVDGKELLEVNALGQKIRTLGKTDPISGENLTITIDAKLQKAVFDAMKDVKKGAAIVSTPQGEILAMVSKPSFDPNLFTMGKDYKIATDASYAKTSNILLDSENQPLLNRAISGMYPPGSTFKIVVAAAGLEDNIINKDFQIQDTGIVKLGDFSFANWYYTEYGGTDGSVDVVKAIKRSNDIFFYKLADMVGVDKLSQFAQKFGIGSELGVDIDGEAKGLLPTPEWKEKVVGEPWYEGDNYHYGIGQGYLLTTPIQVNAWTQAIANGGVLYQPHLLMSNEPKIMNKGLLNSENFDLIRQGMIEACSTGGVAWPLFNFRVKNKALQSKEDGKDFYSPPEATSSAGLADSVGVTIACKTGTAQHGGDNTLPHAWITLFAPAYHPQIVVTVLKESAGEGSNEAAPIAKTILENWFSNQH